jgi:OPA family glycerol-3-phosphate transporter-like MFS transporter
MFGAISGTLISFGVYCAFDWGERIAEMAKAGAAKDVGWLHGLIQWMFAPEDGSKDATWAVFFVPAALLLVWAVLDWWLRSVSGTITPVRNATSNSGPDRR